MSVTSVVLLGVSSVHGTYTDTMYATRGDSKVLPCKLPVEIDPSKVVVRVNTLLLSGVSLMALVATGIT